MEDKRVLRSLRLLQIEGLLTRSLIAAPVMVFFYHSINMDQKLIGYSQAACSLTILFFDIPFGWLADCFSRKYANAIGDALIALALVAYALSGNFWSVVVCEVVFGLGLAFSNGADRPLMQAYCEQLNLSYAKEVARVEIYGPFAEVAGLLLGGIFGAKLARWAIFASAIPSAIGAVLSLFLIEMGVRHSANGKHPLRDIWDIIKLTLSGDEGLAWAAVASATSREITHSLVWLLTPVLVLAHVPAWLLGIAWATNMVAVSCGAWLARKFSSRVSDAQGYALAMSLGIAVCLTFSWQINIATVGLYGLFGLIRGWSSVTMTVLVQHRAPKAIQTTVSSVASSIGRLLFVPLVAIVNAAGNHDIRQAFLANAIVFLPLMLLTVRGLNRSRTQK